MQKNENKGSLAFFVSLAFILILLSFGVRLFGYFKTQNAALGIESVHIIVDFMLTLFVLVVLGVTRSKFSRRFSYGLFKLEDLVAFFIALFIIYMGVDFLLTGLSASPSASFYAFLFQLLSIVPLFLAGYFKILGGEMMHSSSLKADGRHTYTDVYEGLGVAFGLLLYSYTGAWLFYLFAVLLAFLVLLETAVSIARDSLFGLLDLTKDKNIEKKIRKIAESVPEVKEVKDVKVRWSGPVIFVELVVEMNPLLSIDDAHPITDVIERSIKAEIEDVYSVLVHVEPVGRKSFKVVVPVKEKRRDAEISEVLAKSRYFAVVDIKEGEEKVSFVDNPLNNMSAHVAPNFIDFLENIGATDLICRSIGDSVYGLLLAYNIFCWRSEEGTLEENIELFKARKLRKMKEFIKKAKNR